jgi:hypothetical protein
MQHPRPISRKSPRFSLNKIGEYLGATPLQRRGLIEAQQRPKTPIVMRYTEAERAIGDALRTGESTPVHDAIRVLRAKVPRSDRDRVRINCCLYALQRFLALDLAGVLDGMSLERPTTRSASFQYGGLEVSVMPNLIGRDHARGRLGLVKFHISKAHRLEDAAGIAIAALAAHYAAVHLASLGQMDPERVVVVDVMAARWWAAPRRSVRILRDVEAACEEIAARWPSIGEG